MYVWYVRWKIWFGCCACAVTSVFFFCKQKTAYEMRISDWSSDVCSSDLRQPGMVERRQRLLHRMRDRRARAFEPDLAHRLAEFEPILGLEIGRASCRERVRPYV